LSLSCILEESVINLVLARWTSCLYPRRPSHAWYFPEISPWMHDLPRYLTAFLCSSHSGVSAVSKSPHPITPRPSLTLLLPYRTAWIFAFASDADEERWVVTGISWSGCAALSAPGQPTQETSLDRAPSPNSIGPNRSSSSGPGSVVSTLQNANGRRVQFAEEWAVAQAYMPLRRCWACISLNVRLWAIASRLYVIVTFAQLFETALELEQETEYGRLEMKDLQSFAPASWNGKRDIEWLSNLGTVCLSIMLGPRFEGQEAWRCGRVV